MVRVFLILTRPVSCGAGFEFRAAVVCFGTMSLICMFVKTIQCNGVCFAKMVVNLLLAQFCVYIVDPAGVVWK